MEKLAYNKTEAAKALGVPVEVINLLIKKGIVPVMRVGSKTIISKKALEDALSKNIELPSAYTKMSEETKRKLRGYGKSKNAEEVKEGQ